jgi:hypothetical protein
MGTRTNDKSIIHTNLHKLNNKLFGGSFSHNLCFKYSNETCEPILDSYISRAFKWYK